VRFAVTTFPSLDRMFAHHAACAGSTICDHVLNVAPIAEGLALAAELKQVFKQDVDLDVPKFNCLFPGNRINDDVLNNVASCALHCCAAWFKVCMGEYLYA